MDMWIGVSHTHTAGGGLDGEWGLGVDVRNESENQRRGQSAKKYASGSVSLEIICLSS
jgi:hypothetical protein